MKHAYLIMAHGSWAILEKLLKLLDSDRHDFYIHIDKTSVDVPDIKQWVTRSGLFFIERKEILWAEYSMTHCEMRLIEAALKRGDYSYLHLLSGVDLPLKPANEIFDFFENSQKNFVPMYEYPNTPRRIKSVRVYHPLIKCRSFRSNKLIKGLDRAMEYTQRAVGINRLRKNPIVIRDGWNWFSIRRDLAAYTLEQEPEVKKIFHSTVAGEEKFLQTVSYNSDFRKTLASESDVLEGSMRMIDWQRGTPYVWGNAESDFDELMSCPYMFARKFDEEHMEIVDKIFQALTAFPKS